MRVDMHLMMVGYFHQAAHAYRKIKPSCRNAGLIMQDNCKIQEWISHNGGNANESREPN